MAEEIEILQKVKHFLNFDAFFELTPYDAFVCVGYSIDQIHVMDALNLAPISVWCLVHSPLM